MSSIACNEQASDDRSQASPMGKVSPAERRGEEKQPPANVVVPLSEVPRFLKGSDEGGERIALASYPRSGNSLVRRLLESVTGIVTGSDTKPGRGMAELLRDSGLIGEGETKKKRSGW